MFTGKIRIEDRLDNVVESTVDDKWTNKHSINSQFKTWKIRLFCFVLHKYKIHATTIERKNQKKERKIRDDIEIFWWTSAIEICSSCASRKCANWWKTQKTVFPSLIYTFVQLPNFFTRLRRPTTNWNNNSVFIFIQFCQFYFLSSKFHTEKCGSEWKMCSRKNR